MQHLKASVLHKDNDMLIINKPAGLPVQGGDAIRVSLDSLLPQLSFGSAERPRCLPTSWVHILDSRSHCPFGSCMDLRSNASISRDVT